MIPEISSLLKNISCDSFFFSHSKLCHKDCHKANAMRVNRVIMETTDLNCLQFIMELLILTSVMKKHFTGENCKFTFQ